MRIRRALVGLIVVGVSALVAGCGGSDDNAPDGGSTAAASPTPSLSALDQLRASTAGFGSTSYKYTVGLLPKGAKTFGETKEGIESVGGFDPKAANLTATTSLKSASLNYKLDVLAVDGAHYIKYTGVSIKEVPAGKWVKLDITKISSPRSLFLGGVDDPSGAQSLTKSVVTAEKNGDTFNGTLDLTKGITGLIASSRDVTKLGDKAKSVPYEAQVDDKGRLVAFTIQSPFADPAEPAAFIYGWSAFGDTITVNKPAADQTVDASPGLYSRINA